MTKQEYVINELNKLSTPCCGGKYIHINNHYECSVCGQNTSIDVLLLVDVIEEEYDNNEQLKQYLK